METAIRQYLLLVWHTTQKSILVSDLKGNSQDKIRHVPDEEKFWLPKSEIRNWKDWEGHNFSYGREMNVDSDSAILDIPEWLGDEYDLEPCNGMIDWE